MAKKVCLCVIFQSHDMCKTKMLWCNLILKLCFMRVLFVLSVVTFTGEWCVPRTSSQSSYFRLTLMWFSPSLRGLTSIPLPRIYLITEWRVSVPHDKKNIHQMRSSRTTLHKATFDVMSFPLEANAWSYFFLFSGIPCLLSLSTKAMKEFIKYSYSRFKHGSKLSMIFIPPLFSFFLSFLLFFIFRPLLGSNMIIASYPIISVLYDFSFSGFFTFHKVVKH